MSTLTATLPSVNFNSTEDSPESDDYRPTFDPAYYPTLEEERDARELFDVEGDDEPTDADWDSMAEDSAAMDAVCSGHYAF